jgi:MYXO-CTERM domain-containing protein
MLIGHSGRQPRWGYAWPSQGASAALRSESTAGREGGGLGGGAPYQEKVFGWIEHTGGRWAPTALAYPNPGDCGGAGSPPELPEPSCASPTDCTGTRPTHPTACNGEAGGGGSGGGGGGEGGSGDGGGAAGGGGAPSATSTTGSGDGTSGTGANDAGTGGSGGEEEPPGDSCACRMAGAGDPRSPRPQGAWLVFALAALALRRVRPARP